MGRKEIINVIEKDLKVRPLRLTDTPILAPGTEVLSEEEVPYFLLLNELGFSYARINDIGLEILNLCGGENTMHRIIELCSKRYAEDHNKICEKVVDFLETLLESGLVCTPDEIPRFSEMSFEMHPYEVWLHITKKCNLKCITCYSSAGRAYEWELPSDAIKNIIDECCALKAKEIIISGGEPLLREDIKSILSYIKKKGLWVHLITNATLINEEKASMLKEVGVDFVQVSLDGSSAQVNDRIRGKGAFDKTMKGVEHLKQAGLNFSLYPTLTKLNIDDFMNMFDLFTKLTNRPSIGCAYFAPVGRGVDNKEQLELPIEEFSKLTYQVFEKVRKREGKPPFDFFFEMGRVPPNKYRKTNCGLGSDVISIDADGSIYPCQWLHFPQFKAGNICEGSLRQIYYASDIFNMCRKLRVDSNIDQCSSCKFRYICGGGCRAMAFLKDGSLYAKDPLCSFFKGFIEAGLWGISPEKFNEMKGGRTNERGNKKGHGTVAGNG